ALYQTNLHGLYNENTLIRFILNQKEITTGLPPGMVLLDFIRYHQHLAGTKVGCREGDCGACTVLVGELVNEKPVYRSMTSCLVPLGNVQGKHIVTIEGINEPDSLNTVQELMADEGATQCGFCTPGFVMSMTGFCLGHNKPTGENAVAAIDGNICRCTGYKSIQRAAERLATIIQDENDNGPVARGINKQIVPAYFAGIGDRLLLIHDTEKIKQLSDLAASPSRPHVVGGGTDLYVQKHDEMTHAGIRFVFDHPSLSTISLREEQIKNTHANKKQASADPDFLFVMTDAYKKFGENVTDQNKRDIAG
ncbi:2Fe-2S iron-sulfur cluster-binding domain protein, partial [Ostertagia ostertagi]